MTTRLAAVAIGALVATLGTAHAASATPGDEGTYSSAFWDGGGSLKDDFSDHFGEIGNSLCNGCADSWNTGGVRAWQAILLVDGYLAPAGVDGRFGPATAAATRNYQDDHGLDVDGRVGPQTWKYADNQLRWYASGTQVLYRGAEGSVYFERGNSDHGNAHGGGAYRIIKACVSTYCDHYDRSRIYH